MSNPIVRTALIDGEEVFDEFIATGVDVHIEAMSNNTWLAIISLPDGETWHVQMGARNPRTAAYAFAERTDR